MRYATCYLDPMWSRWDEMCFMLLVLVWWADMRWFHKTCTELCSCSVRYCDCARLQVIFCYTWCSESSGVLLIGSRELLCLFGRNSRTRSPWVIECRGNPWAGGVTPFYRLGRRGGFSEGLGTSRRRHVIQGSDTSSRDRLQVPSPIQSVVPIPSERFFSLTDSPYSSHTHFDTYPPVSSGRNGYHGESTWLSWWWNWTLVDCADWTPEVTKKRSVSRWVCKNKSRTNPLCNRSDVLGISGINDTSLGDLLL
jgi:hypothetical protein